MKAYETLLSETIGDHLLQVTLNRPEVANARNTQMGLDLLDLWTGLIDDPGDIRCVILTGAGEKIFCAGGDLKQRKGMTPKQWQHQHEIFERGRDALLDCPVPVIAAVNGHAFAGGLETVLVCDFAYAVSTRSANRCLRAGDCRLATARQCGASTSNASAMTC